MNQHGTQDKAPGQRSPLEGVRVLDLSRILAGPYCAMIMGDYGADVIKIEQPGLGDGSRQWGPPWVGSQSAYFQSANRNKRSMTLNLKHEKGRAILRELVQRADVLIENFKPDTMARMGLAYESLAELNPALIYCAITGYGQTGPYRDRPGYDFAIQAQGGLMSITGPVDGPPHKTGVAIVDVTAGLFAANAILAALHERGNSNQGQYIDVALLDAQLAWLINVAHNYFATGEAPRRFGNAHPNIVPYQTFTTRDGWIALAVGSDRQFRSLCQVIERSTLWEDERFRTNAGRVEHRRELVSQLQERLQQRETETWITLFQNAGIPAAPVNTIPTIFADPHVLAREMIQEVQGEDGPVKQLGPVARLSRTPASIRRAPPDLGLDTETVLADLLGYASSEIAALYEEGVL